MSSNLEFEELFKEYQKELNKSSGGLIEAKKDDFMKMTVFFSVVDMKQLERFAKGISKGWKR
jgi:hypothetical protein